MLIKLKKGVKPFRVNIVVKDGVDVSEDIYKQIKDRVEKIKPKENKK